MRDGSGDSQRAACAENLHGPSVPVISEPATTFLEVQRTHSRWVLELGGEKEVPAMVGRAGRKRRPSVGDMSDHISVLLEGEVRNSGRLRRLQQETIQTARTHDAS